MFALTPIFGIDPNSPALTQVFAPNKDSATVSVQLFRLVIDYTESQGGSVPELLRRAGIRASHLDDSDLRLPYRRFSALTRAAAETLGDPLFGLHAGASVKPGHLGALGIVLMSCRTVRDALDRSHRFSGLVMNACSNEVAIGPEECVRHWRSRLADCERLDRFQEEMNMVVWITLARWLSGDPRMAPNWVRFHHSAPPDRREYEKLFGCPVVFEAEETALGFPTEWLAMELPQANRTVLHAMDRVCQQLLDRLALEQVPAWLKQVRKAIVRTFSTGTPTLAEAARAVSREPDELAGMLERSGISFRVLVDRLRHELALEYLDDPDHSLLDIAFLLGFSEQSAFQRAFKRWTGKTPGEYRRHLHAGETA